MAQVKQAQPAEVVEAATFERIVTSARALLQSRLGQEKERLRKQAVRIAFQSVQQQVEFLDTAQLLSIASRHPRIAHWQIDGSNGRPMKFTTIEEALRAAITGFLMQQLADEFALIQAPQLTLIESSEVAA